jgi:hypothetical protein
VGAIISQREVGGVTISSGERTMRRCPPSRARSPRLDAEPLSHPGIAGRRGRGRTPG